MDQNEYDDLSAQVDAYMQQDAHLGRILKALLIQVGNVAGAYTQEAPAVVVEPVALPAQEA